MAASPLPSPGPTNGGNCYVTPAFSGVQKQGDQIRSGCLTPAFSGAHKWVELLPLHVTPAFSGVPSKGDKIGIGYLTPTFLGAHKWVELLRNPCILGGPLQTHP